MDDCLLSVRRISWLCFMGVEMTPEEKVALLKEARVWDVIGFPGCIDKLIDLVAAHERNRHAWTQEHWTQYEHAIAAAEREACAKVCEEEHDKSKFGVNGMHCAAAIRARGLTKSNTGE